MDAGSRLSGVVLAGRYELSRILGRGGMGEVWLGRDVSILRREVAVKVLTAFSDQNSVGRFQQEAEILARLQHPGITVVHDAGFHDSYLFIVMELLRGSDMAQLLVDHPDGLPVPRVLDLVGQTTHALRAAHGLGVVHRDIKPANLFVQAGDRVKICDFGIARNTVTAPGFTATGASIGTPAYMSPEQCRAVSVDARSDLYSLGCVMFELLTGRTPFRSDQPLYLLLGQHVNQAPPHLSSLRGGVPRQLDDLVMALLAKNPDDRPALSDVSSVLADLESGNHVRGVPPTEPVGPQVLAATVNGKGAAGPSQARLSIRYAIRSHVGLIAEHNEDSAYAGPTLLAVADGMGRQGAGKMASAVVVATLARLDAAGVESAVGEPDLAALGGAVVAANERLRVLVADRPELEGMGTTLTAMLWSGTRFGMVHVGSSRAYRLRDNVLQQMTADHTVVQRLVDEGKITEEEAGHHPQRSLLMRALDGQTQVEADIGTFGAFVGDRYLLCSNGLSDLVSQETLAQTLTAYNDPQTVVNTLIRLALRAGGRDNITCIVADTTTSPGSLDPIVAGAASEPADPRQLPRIDVPEEVHPSGRAARLRQRREGRRPSV